MIDSHDSSEEKDLLKMQEDPRHKEMRRFLVESYFQLKKSEVEDTLITIVFISMLLLVLISDLFGG